MKTPRTMVVGAAVSGAAMAICAFLPADAEAIGARTGTERANPTRAIETAPAPMRYAQRRGGAPGGARPAARPSGGGRPGAGGTSGNRNINSNSNRNINSNRNLNTNRNVNRNVNINRNVNVTVKHRGYGWRGVHWGAVAFGVTMGTIITVAANTPPPPPDPSLCWTWTNSAKTTGYWYYCSGP
jgi:hypothetical protein